MESFVGLEGRSRMVKGGFKPVLEGLRVDHLHFYFDESPYSFCDGVLSNPLRGFCSSKEGAAAPHSSLP